MMRLFAVVPDVDQLLALSHAELALHILTLFAKDSTYREMLRERTPRSIHRQNVTANDYPEARRWEVELAISEAWAWMEREILVVPESAQNPGWSVLTRLGRSFLANGNARALHAARRVDRSALHEALRDDALANFYRGAYDVAVFLAFREVEIAVGKAAGFSETGVQLMAKSFSHPSGPLRDPNGSAGEEDAVRNLLSGAMGYFRNATGHRDANITADSCADLLAFATQLLMIIDSRVERRSQGWPAT